MSETSGGSQTSGLSVARIEEALGVIDPVFLDSPLVELDALSKHLGARVSLKIETLNPIRSFKGRGGCVVVSRQPRNAHLVAASAGNFGQGLAYAATRRGLPLTVFASKNANTLKVARMRELGAAVRLAGEDFDDSKEAAERYAKQIGGVLIVDGREAAVSEGAGTIALEMLRQAEAPDSIVLPLGNGAMLNGIGTWIKAAAPATRIIGVCASGAPSMERSWRRGEVVTTAAADTIADGIAVRAPVPEAIADMHRTADDVLLVDDESILKAMRLILDKTGILVEPSGAVGVAAVQQHRAMFAGSRVATVLCGGNVTQEQFATWFRVGG